MSRRELHVGARGQVTQSRPVCAARAGLLLAGLLVGCGGYEDVHAEADAYHRALDHHIHHATEEQVARGWGPPERRDVIGGLEFWTYYRDLGTTSSSRAVYVGNGMTVAHGRTRARYDKVVMTFKDGVLETWHVDIVR